MSVHTNGDSTGAEFLGYRIDGAIGQGGMGVVHRAYDVRLKRTIALKLMAPPLALDERFRDRFTRESELAMSLEHPNVVPIYDAGEADGRLFLAMRYVEGTDLRARLRREGALAPADAISLFKQVASALDAAHAKGLVHRDVKPSNVLVDADGHAYLADFGLTQRLAEQSSLGRDGRSLGTPAYLAPEQIEGRQVDGRADVYSLGCMLYECLTGTAPFSRGSRLALVWAHLEEDPPSASERNDVLPEAIDEVIRKAMAKEPEDRYETCAELVAAAEAALGLGQSSPPRRRSGRILASTAAIAALLAAVFLAVLARGGDEAARASLVVRANTLVRLDPATNKITAVIEVGARPAATAVVGRTVWVYNVQDGSVAEIDAGTNELRHTTKLSATPANTSEMIGPVLAADAAGAWLIGYTTGNKYLLTHVRPGGQGKREYLLRHYPAAVAVGDEAVWVLTGGLSDHQLLRVDPTTGGVEERFPLPGATPADGLAVAGGAAWVMDSGDARLFRVDLRSGATRVRDLGDVAQPPVVGFGSIWICAANPGSSMLRIDPRTLRTTFALNSLPAEQGRFAVGYGSLWRHDIPTGTVMRFDPETGKVSATLRVSPEAPRAGEGLAPTAVATGAGSVWVTVARI